MIKDKFFAYSWNIDDNEENRTVIRIYGLDSDNLSTCVVITDFTPYVYVELPITINWNDTRANMLGKKIDEICGKYKPLKKSLVMKKKLYYGNVRKIDESYNYKLYPYLMLSFCTKSEIKNFIWKIKRKILVTGLGYVSLKAHEQDADPILQLTCIKDIPTAGWIYFSGKKVSDESKETYCDKEYKVKWKNLIGLKEVYDVPKPLIMGFDIEVYSTNPNKMPDVKKPGDKVFQICCILSRYGDKEKDYEKYLLTLGEPNQKIVGEDAEIRSFYTESDLLVGFSKFIIEKNPQILVGYNILSFDIPYMIDRSKDPCMCIYEFDQMSCRKYHHAKERIIKWSSSAYKNQEFQFLDAEGRLFVDLLPIVKRDYKLDNYKLKTVSTFFLGSTKDPLTAKGIFKCYKMGMQRNKKGEYTKKAKKAMGVVGKYCLVDGILCNKLFETLQTWVGLSEMAKTCNVPIFYLYTQGQQIKVYSQVYKKCMYDNFVVEKDGYIPAEDEQYTGATVFEPIPGAYDKVVPFDFASLYPTTIIAYNICYSTLVNDDTIPDSDCNVIEWEDHVGCCHDKQVRKTKVKRVICAKRRYRFLKSPRGVIPTLLQQLLNARKETRKEIKVLKKSLGNIDDNIEIENINTKITVLNKRQLAYKVSANSVGGYTPILCKKEEKILYLTIEELSKGDWKSINDEQEVSTPIDNIYVWSDKGFTKPKFVMRHPQEKPLNRIITHTGLVDCTDDHSLLSPDGTEVTPTNLKIGDELMHCQYPLPKDTPELPLFRSISNDTIENYTLNTSDEEINFLYGLFFAEGSCGTWGKPGKTKSSWIIYNQDKKLLNRALVILSKYFSDYGNFLISKYYESASVYHLTIRGKVKKFSDKFRKMFYDNRKYKKIPDEILNDIFKNRQAFFMGYYSGDGNRHIKTGVIINNKGMRGTASLMYLANSLGYKVSISNGKNNLIFRLQCCTEFRYRNKDKQIKTIRKTYKNQKICSTRSTEIRNSEKIEFNGNESSYRNIQILCNRFPRQKLLDSLDKAILCANNRKSYIKKYNTSNKKITYKKYCCEKEIDISLRSLKMDLSESNNCKCNQQNVILDFNNKNIYTPNKIEYVYDIETENHHFAAGIGHMIVHNSMYGAMGVRRGYLPFLPGAMCTTAKGRQSIEKAAKEIQLNHKGTLIYGDTDSAYITFPHLTTSQEIWDYCLEVEEKVSALYPKPMKLEFEEVIYWRFFILTKKRYMYLECGRNGELSNKVGKKGVLLARRDNSMFIRKIYEKIVMMIFNKATEQEVLYEVLTRINELCSATYPHTDFVISKSVGAVADYKVRPLPTDEKKRKKRLKDLKIPLEWENIPPSKGKIGVVKNKLEEVYLIRCLPAQIQLAEKLRRRGMRIDAGTRLQYLVTDTGNIKDKLCDKIEDPDYRKEHSDLIKIDYMYYLKLASNPLDQAVNVAYKVKDFVLNQYKFRLKRMKVLDQLKSMYKNRIKIID